VVHARASIKREKLLVKDRTSAAWNWKLEVDLQNPTGWGNCPLQLRCLCTTRLERLFRMWT